MQAVCRRRLPWALILLLPVRAALADGRLIDIASIRQAEALLNKAAAMGM